MSLNSVVPALRPFARSRLHGGAAAWREAALPRRDELGAAHRAEIVHGVAEQRVLVAVEVAVSRAVERLRACAEARGAPALHRPVHLVRLRLRLRVRVRVRVRSALSTSPSTHEALR